MFTVKKKCAMDKLLLDINLKKEEMIELGLKMGFQSAETIKISQELDVLILQYQRYKEEMDKSRNYSLFLSNFFKKWYFSMSKAIVQFIVTAILK
ncbi:MAG: aspartyl-phosphate phosphatase Spo0E family protein [Ectobacillus sp.]